MAKVKFNSKKYFRLKLIEKLNLKEKILKLKIKDKSYL